MPRERKTSDETTKRCYFHAGSAIDTPKRGSLVSMATNDKQSQTARTPENVPMYDETVVVDASEIDSPSSDEEVVRATMAKFNPPVRHTARHDFDSDSQSDSGSENFLGNTSLDDQVSLCLFVNCFRVL